MLFPITIILTILIIVANGKCYFVLYSKAPEASVKLKPGDIRYYMKTSNYGGSIDLCSKAGDQLMSIDTEKKYKALLKCLEKNNDRLAELWTFAEGRTGVWQGRSGKNVTGHWCAENEVRKDNGLLFTRQCNAKGCYKLKRTIEYYSPLCEYHGP